MSKQPIEFFDADDLIMSASSYYLGRMTRDRMARGVEGTNVK